MGLPSSMYMMMSPLGLYVLFGMGIKLVKKESDNVHRDLPDRRVSGGTVCTEELDRGK
jgi:hypothetical protein